MLLAQSNSWFSSFIGLLGFFPQLEIEPALVHEQKLPATRLGWEVALGHKPAEIGARLVKGDSGLIALALIEEPLERT